MLEIAFPMRNAGLQFNMYLQGIHFYESHSRINDTEFISRKIVLDSVFLLCHMRTHILPIHA